MILSYKLLLLVIAGYNGHTLFTAIPQFSFNLESSVDFLVVSVLVMCTRQMYSEVEIQQLLNRLLSVLGF